MSTETTPPAAAAQAPAPGTVPAPVPTSGRRPKLGLRSAVWLKSGQDSFTVVLDLARRAEQAGFDGIFFGDRMLAEVGEGGRGVYNSTHTEIFTTLAAIAASTERIAIGSLVLVVPFRHPVPLAKTIASLDLLSHGRLLLGVGTGWNPAEFAVMGVDKKQSAAILEENVEILKRLWTGEPVHYNGRFLRLDGVAVEPTPYTASGPPIWLGSFSPLQESIWKNRFTTATDRALARVGRMADTWIPLLYSTRFARSIDPAVLAESFAKITDAAAAAGRPPGSVGFAFSHWYYVLETARDVADAERDLAAFFPGDLDAARETYLIGTPEQIVAKIRHLCSQISAPEWMVFTQLGNNPRQLELLTTKVFPLLETGA